MTAPDVPAVPAVALPVLARDRETAVERLRDAYADGQLSHDDLDALLDQVLTTTSRDVVDSVVAGLPTPAAGGALEIDAINGKIRREGRWQVPRRIRISSEYGKVRLDLSEATFAAPEVEIELELTYGRARIVVPAGATVDLDGLRTDWKQPRYDARRRSGGGGPLVRITGHMEYRRLTVRHSRA